VRTVTERSLPRGTAAGGKEKEMKHNFKLVSLPSPAWLALLFGLAIVLLITGLSYRGWTAFGRHEDQLEVTQRTVAGTSALLLALTNAETGQRGFLLTGEERYLAPYLQARVDLPRLLKSLAMVGLVHPDQGQRIKSLVPLVNDKLAELALTIELRRSKGLDASLAVVRTDRGRVLMEQVRGICSEIQTVTVRRLTSYSQQARSRGNQGGLTSIFGGACLFCLLLGATVAIQRGTARRQSLIGELQQSERRLEEAAADAEAANRAKSRFLSTMSHEIRTPMNAILGYAQLMLRDPGLGTEAKANLEIIGRSGEHLLALINDVLDMSKIEAGRIELNPVTFNLPKLLADLAAMFRLRAAAKALQFEMSVDGESVPYVAADEGKIRQALINLLGNAIKFTERGQIKLRVTLDQRNADRLWLSARVEDTGAGITGEGLKKLFEPFSQAEQGLNTQEGTGLGLAISRQYARLMGGDLTVSSSPGTGSIFRFDIPIERGDAAVAIRRSAPRRVMGIRAGTQAPKILVVDDQLENRDWLMKLLTAIGFSVRSAANGAAAIRDWEEWNPGLILMDVHMPIMDGIEATRRIKGDPRGKETVIVTLTASALDDDRRVALQGGADDFLAKPCREDQLLEKISALLNIAYDYEETNAAEGQTVAGAAALSADKLEQLPRDLIEEIRDATLAGNKKLLDKVIAKVRGTGDAASARALQELADKYEYDALTRLLEEVCCL
jgi:signal transduction histidine kinase/DNA-binding response OmpR family regulator